MTRHDPTEIRYLTDEVHLYEIVAIIQNAGVVGGVIMTVRDCVTEITRELNALEQKICRMVTPNA